MTLFVGVASRAAPRNAWTSASREQALPETHSCQRTRRILSRHDGAPCQTMLDGMPCSAAGTRREV